MIERLFKSILAALAVIGAVYGGILGLDARYAMAAEVRQINRQLGRIEIRQLQDELRTIRRDTKGRPLTDSEQKRLETIAQEIQVLQEELKK